MSEEEEDLKALRAAIKIADERIAKIKNLKGFGKDNIISAGRGDAEIPIMDVCLNGCFNVELLPEMYRILAGRN